MIQWMSRLSKSWLASIFMGALALSFIVWGIADVFTGQSSTALATVGPVEISSQQFSRDYRNLLRNESQRTGTQITTEMANKMGIGPQELQRLISRTALDTLAAKLGLTTPDAQLAREVRALPAFKGASGQFDHQLFLQIIGQAGYGEQEFLEDMRHDDTRNQLLDTLEGRFELPPAYAQALFLYITEKRAADYVVMSEDSLAPIPPPTDATLTAFVKAHPERFSTPEYRAIEYAAITPQEVAPQVNVTDKMVADYYKDHLSDYMIPEKRDIEQVEFPSEAEAKAAHDKVASGKMTFEALATSRKIAPQNLSLGSLSKQDIPDAARANAAFSLPLNQVSEPVKGALSGYVLLRVTKITPAVSHTLDQVKNDIHQKLALELAGAKITDMVNAFEDARSGGADIAQAAKKVGMRSGSIAAVDRQGLGPDGQKVANLPSDPEFLQTAFTQEVGDDTDPFPAKSGAYYAVKVDGVTPSKLKPLDQVRGEATAAWTAEQKAKALAKKAQDLAQQAQKDGNLDAIAKTLNVKVQESPALTRGTNDQTFPAAVVADLFNAKPNGVVEGPEETGTSYIIARVTGISHAAPDAASQQMFAGGAAQVSAQAAGNLSDSLANEARERQGVSVNQQLLEQAIGGQS